MTEIEAKVSYVKLARSLKTYGVSFFLVKVRKMSLMTVCCSFWLEVKDRVEIFRFKFKVDLKISIVGFSSKCTSFVFCHFTNYYG